MTPMQRRKQAQTSHHKPWLLSTMTQPIPTSTVTLNPISISKGVGALLGAVATADIATVLLLSVCYPCRFANGHHLPSFCPLHACLFTTRAPRIARCVPPPLSALLRLPPRLSPSPSFTSVHPLPLNMFPSKACHFFLFFSLFISYLNALAAFLLSQSSHTVLLSLTFSA